VIAVVLVVIFVSSVVARDCSAVIADVLFVIFVSSVVALAESVEIPFVRESKDDCSADQLAVGPVNVAVVNVKLLFTVKLSTFVRSELKLSSLKRL